MQRFKAPETSLGTLDAGQAAAVIAAASDIALVIDKAGLIRDVAVRNEDLARELPDVRAWLGKPWTATVTIESRPKINDMLNGEARPRHVNHPTRGRADVPILYSVVRLGGSGPVLAIGRDLRPLSVLQNRLVEAQQSMERDYARLRHSELRYRLLFQTSAEPVLIVDAATQKVTEANPAAGTRLGKPPAALAGTPFAALFGGVAAEAAQAFLAAVRGSGRQETRLPLRGEDRDSDLSASLFRQDNTLLLLVRLGGSAAAIETLPPMTANLWRVVERAPDAFVVTDENGRILFANTAFADMTQRADASDVEGASIDQWLGRPGVDLNVLITNLRLHGSVRLFATQLRGEFGSLTQVEIAAVSVSTDTARLMGFLIREVGRRLKSDVRPVPELPQPVAHLTELVGRVSLKDLVREATDVIEKLSIEAALELTADNRAAAAEMLGLSRQSLYVKLRRYGLIDPASEADDGNV